MYWLLVQRLPVLDPRLLPLLAGVARALHGDPAVVDVARCMRLPGSKNWKYTPAREAVVSSWHPERRYTVDALLAAVPAPEPHAGNGHAAAPPVEDVIPEGQRNPALSSLAGTMRRRGMTPGEIAVALAEVNRNRCRPPLPDDEVERIARSISRYAPAAEAPGDTPHDTPAPGALRVVGAGTFLAEPDHEPVALVDSILSDDGGGWISGEEKLGKSWWMIEEAVCLALGLPVCGRFPVETRRRVLVLEEEDSPRRVRRRLRALLRGKGLDPESPAVRDDLDAWLRVSVWSGFSLDNAALVDELRAAIDDFRPAICYIDCLRKVTHRNLNHADEASALLAVLDRLRREYEVIFRLVHHYRKQQGFRTGRGSQEIGGSFVLGAWGENSLFFEPIGRKAGAAVRVEVQSKDGAAVPAVRLRIESEGPPQAPTCVRLIAEDDEADGSETDEQVFQAVATLPPEPAHTGTAGVTVVALAAAVKKSDKTVRGSLTRLCAAERCLETGKTSKQAKLYGVKAS